MYRLAGVAFVRVSIHKHTWYGDDVHVDDLLRVSQIVGGFAKVGWEA